MLENNIPNFRPNGTNGGLSSNDVQALNRVCEDILTKDKPVVCELGCWTGLSTTTIASVVYARGGFLFSVDWFKGSPETTTHEWAEKFPILSYFLHNMEILGIDPNAWVVDYSKVVNIIQDGSLDMLFLDSDHRYTQISRDLGQWIPKVKAGGIVAGHDLECLASECAVPLEDYGERDYTGAPHRLHPGVIRAVCEHFPEKDIVILKGSKIWYARRESWKG